MEKRKNKKGTQEPVSVQKENNIGAELHRENLKHNIHHELSPAAIVIGILISVLFGAANAYLGLKVGLTISASIPAAVMSLGIMRGILRRSSLLESNMVQTIGSAGESVALFRHCFCGQQRGAWRCRLFLRLR